MVREVRDSTLTDEWYMDMVKKDQDDCTKRLICEVSHKKTSGQSLSSVEEGILEVFGEGTAVDTSKSTAVFDFAAHRLANTGRWVGSDASSLAGVTLLWRTLWP